MQIENPKLDERHNPNITHEPATRELSRLLLQVGLLLLIIFALARALAWGIGHYLPYAYEQRYLAPLAQGLLADTHSDPKLQALADQLAHQMDLPAGMQVKIHVSAEPDFNAFATFGGNIVVMQGLLEQAPTEQALSMVLAHEMAHVQHRDSLKAVSQSALLQLARAAIFGEQSAINQSLMLGMLSYSRGQETAADETALATLQAHYGSIAGGIEMYDLLAQKAGESPKRKWLPNWLATHPDTVKRQEHLRDYAQRNGYNPQGNTTPNPWLKPNTTAN